MTDPLFWVAALPALAASGLLFQMILSLFTCCGTFRLRGRTVRLAWWMIPVTGGVCGLLWTVAVGYALLG
jgi:hypothetical protein